MTGPLASSNVAAAADEAGSALGKAFDRKVRGAAEACQEQGLVFLPIAIKTLPPSPSKVEPESCNAGQY